MEERKSYGMVMLFVSVFVVFLVSIMSYSLWRDKLKWFTEFGHLNRGDMLTSEQHRCHNEKKKFQRRV